MRSNSASAFCISSSSMVSPGFTPRRAERIVLNSPRNRYLPGHGAEFFLNSSSSFLRNLAWSG